MLSKFLNTKTLIILLLILGGIYLVTKLTEKEERTFKTELVAIDTSKVSKIVVIPKLGGGDQVTLTKTGEVGLLNQLVKLINLMFQQSRVFWQN